MKRAVLKWIAAEVEFLRAGDQADRPAVPEVLKEVLGGLQSVHCNENLPAQEGCRPYKEVHVPPFSVFIGKP